MRLCHLALAIGLVTGCAHEAMGPSMGGIGGQAESSLEGAYESVKSGGKATARGNGFIVEKVSDQTVRVMREAGLSKVAGGVGDPWIANKVKRTVGGDLEVESDAGVVTLRGKVGSQADAVKAIEDTLDVNGVIAVNAELAWPSSQATRKTYEK